MIIMHDWAAVNTWSRPVTNGLNGRYSRYSVNIPVRQEISGRYSVNIPISGMKTPKSGLSRCRTTLLGPANIPDKHQVYKPRLKYGESSTLNYIQYLKDSNKETEAKLHSAVHMLRVQRSKSDITVRETPISVARGSVMGGSLLQEKSQVYMTSSTDFLRHEGSAMGNKQEMRVGMAKVPKKGLIALSTEEPELKEAPASSRYQTYREYEHVKSRPKGLIKRKDIMDHFKAGFKVLEDEETQRQQEEELQKSLGEYTIMDLQSKILEMTDSKSLKGRSPQTENRASAPVSRPVPPPQPLKQKTVTLPAIKTFDPFKGKT